VLFRKALRASNRLIIDQSSGPHALNSTIPKSQVKVKLDNIHDLGTVLLAGSKRSIPNEKLTLFKSDVKSAYRQLPMDPLFQIKQVVSIDGQRHVDRPQHLWKIEGVDGTGTSFASLVNWIGTEEKRKYPISWDMSTITLAGNLKETQSTTSHTRKHLPAKQTRLLRLWDELGIPHDEEKTTFWPLSAHTRL